MSFIFIQYALPDVYSLEICDILVEVVVGFKKVGKIILLYESRNVLFQIFYLIKQVIWNLLKSVCNFFVQNLKQVINSLFFV